MVLVNALYGLGQVLISLDCTMNIIIAACGAKGFPGTNQVMQKDFLELTKWCTRQTKWCHHSKKVPARCRVKVALHHTYIILPQVTSVAVPTDVGPGLV